MALQVASGLVTGILFAEALALVYFDRELAGRFVYAATAAGAIAGTLAVAGALGSKQQTPMEAALAHSLVFWTGYVVGSIGLVVSNALCFGHQLPSFL